MTTRESEASINHPIAVALADRFGALAEPALASGKMLLEVAVLQRVLGECSGASKAILSWIAEIAPLEWALSQAKAQLSIVTEINPQEFRAWYWLGLAHLECGDTAKALSALQMAGGWFSGSAQSFFHAGQILEETGREAEASAHYAAAASVDWCFSAAGREVAERLRRRDPVRAAEWYRAMPDNRMRMLFGDSLARAKVQAAHRLAGLSGCLVFDGGPALASPLPETSASGANAWRTTPGMSALAALGDAAMIWHQEALERAKGAMLSPPEPVAENVALVAGNYRDFRIIRESGTFYASSIRTRGLHHLLLEELMAQSEPMLGGYPVFASETLEGLLIKIDAFSNEQAIQGASKATTG